jgi:uncharacterized protein YacL
MLLWIFRSIFLIVIVAVLFVNLTSPSIAVGEDGKPSEPSRQANFNAIVWSSLGMALFVFLLDVLTPKNKLSALAGVFLGLLVGVLISWAMSPLVDMIMDTYRIDVTPYAVKAMKWMMGICVCYLTISIVMRTKDDVRFVIPYVEFAKQTKGARPLVLDTSAIVDGRIADLCQSRLFDAPLDVRPYLIIDIR